MVIGRCEEEYEARGDAARRGNQVEEERRERELLEETVESLSLSERIYLSSISLLNPKSISDHHLLLSLSLSNPPATNPSSPKDYQCSSTLVRHIKAPVHLVWSLVRRFDQPQKYKPFVSRCVVLGNLEIGSLREVDVKSGLPATTSTERLELLDDDEHLLSIRIIGGDHRLMNYSSIISLHPEIVDGKPETLVIESFVVDVPEGNTKDETCYFVEALIQCNLKSLCDVSERLAVQDHTEPIDRL
uniref:abscisic acid receptor PYL8-like n=1 Tax=Fragaria vesca subsp. vesca TaxID=101020 RepID=UPI0005CADD70|nr:PREDICTED: abscisic acid receptor PYL8-like [Fragaria vesca subsp. vesca]